MGGISLLHSPWSRLHQPLAGTLPYGARTFLIPFGTRSSGHLARFLSYRFTPQKSSGQCPHPARDWVAHLRSEYARVGPACGLRGGTARGGRAVLAGVTPRKGRGATRNMEMRGGSPRAPLVGSAHTRLGGQCPHPSRDWVARLRSEYVRVGLACGLRGGTARKGRGATRSLALRGGSPRAPLAGSVGLRKCRASGMLHDISMKERLPVRPGEESPAARRPGPGAEADPQADTSAAWASRGRRWGSARSPRQGWAWRWDCASA